MGCGAVSRAGGTARHPPAAGSSSRWTQEPSELTNKAGPGVGRGAAPHSCGGQCAPLAPGWQPSPCSTCLLPSLPPPRNPHQRQSQPCRSPTKNTAIKQKQPQISEFQQKRILQRELHYIHLIIKSVFQWSFDSSTCSFKICYYVFSLGAIISTQSISPLFKYPCRYKFCQVFIFS